MGSVRVWGLILVIILSGCATTSVPTESTPTNTPTEEESNVDASSVTKTETSTETPFATATATTTPTPVLPDNPWHKTPIVIGIDNSEDPDRNYSAQVNEAVEYWHENGKNHTEWSANFTVKPNASSPDIVIRFVSEIRNCGRSEGDVVLGCASILEASSVPNDPEVVLVNLGLTDQSTYRVVRHELGHILGLSHGEGPDNAMRSYTIVFNQIVRVHLEVESTAEHEKRDTENQLDYVFEYYSSGADGFLDEDVQFALVEDEEAADVLIRVNDDGDESRAFVEDDVFIIEINGIDTDHRGWHAGYWFGVYFGANSTDEQPPPFDEPESDPRSQWWH
jgi:hypothetical protein